MQYGHAELLSKVKRELHSSKTSVLGARTRDTSADGGNRLGLANKYCCASRNFNASMTALNVVNHGE